MSLICGTHCQVRGRSIALGELNNYSLYDVFCDVCSVPEMFWL